MRFEFFDKLGIQNSGLIIFFIRKKEEGRRKKEEGRGKKEEGRRKKEEGRRKKEEK
ncbi:hypothetical protein [Microcoleus sp. D2_18a_B4]|uniref:hypothetical protein n=1 Tax=Microcoleus sp. D2_18a_B4 TaxID=3055329 RepID=UPI002FD29BB2